MTRFRILLLSCLVVPASLAVAQSASPSDTAVGGNLPRVFRQVEAVSREMQAQAH